MGKTLVTGATGFTGRHLCRRLVKDGRQVVAFVRSATGAESLKSEGVECRMVDITDRSAVRDNFDGIDKVYHLAAAYRTELSDRTEFRTVNVEGSRHLLEAAKDNHVKRFVHCSTVGVQGEIHKPPAHEEYRTEPGDHYQESKLAGERLALEFFSNGLPGTVVRPVGIYGPGDVRFLKIFRPVSKGYFIMIGTGNVLYHMTYIDDLVEGFVLAGEHPNAIGNVFTIAGEKYTTLKELVNMIADVIEKPRPKWRVPYFPVLAAAVLCDRFCRPFGINPPLYPRRVEFFSKDRAFSIEKAKNILGYSPQVGLFDGLKRTAEWYRTQGMI
ncbi:MAG: NAD-dependent epimerase/dehydratase family protein [Desulfobacterales bacterium]